MAKRTILVDDMDGTDAVKTIPFSLENTYYEIDLSQKNIDKIRKALEPFIKAARKAPANRRAPRKNAAPAVAVSRTDQLNAIRDWARKRGMQVSDKGKVPQGIMDAFNKEHDNMPTFSA